MTRPPKYKKRSKEKKRQIVEKALKLSADGESILRIAQSLNIPRSTLRDLLKDDQLFASYKEKQREVLQAEFSKLALRSARQARQKIKKASYKDLVVGSAIAYDKANPPQEAKINIGDNRTMNIKFTKWKDSPFAKSQDE